MQCSDPCIGWWLLVTAGQNREKSLATRVLVGTCPDMCPEKERYRREDTRRLSYFEVRQDSEPRVRGEWADKKVEFESVCAYVLHTHTHAESQGAPFVGS